ncbi:MAG: hydratase, partial [Clostridia bacterium]|nr:hydratase [Clostridia bacterium]
RGFGHPVPEEKLVFGPNITDWPETERLGDDLMIGVCSVIADRVTTTDELIPSGESSSYRSNPIRLSRMTLSRRDPLYVQRADGVRALTGKEEKNPYVSLSEKEIQECTEAFRKARKALLEAAGKGDVPLQIGSMVCARCPGDGSAREQAASCQRVLGALANLSGEYATKRYRSNLINWGMLPLQSKDFSFASDEGKEKIETGDWLLIPGAREKIAGGESDLPAYLYHAREDRVSRHVLSLGDVSEEERKILLAGSLTGFYREDRETVHHSFS